MCYNRQDCWNQEPKRTGIDPELHGSEPVLLYVHGFGFALDDGVISNPNCSGFITLDGRFGMRPTHLDKGLTKLDHGFGVDEEARNFGFGSRGHNKLDYLGDSENRDIYGRDRDIF